MKNRCHNPKSDNYKNYGMRGITVCDEWVDNYSEFKRWALNNGYNESGGRNCSIERIDVNGNYCPENCKLATSKEQMNNTRRNTFVEYDEKRMSLAQWAEYLGINYSSFMSRFDRGWSMERIANTPIRRYKKGGVIWEV